MNKDFETQEKALGYLKEALEQAQCICDPTEFAYRQNQLLHIVAMYLIYKDAPKDDSV